MGSCFVVMNTHLQANYLAIGGYRTSRLKFSWIR